MSKRKSYDLESLAAECAKIPLPPKPNFGDDQIGKIATYMHENRRSLSFPKYMLKKTRRSNREISNARKKTQRDWSRVIATLRDDHNLISLLDNADLLDSLNAITAIIAAGHERIPDDGSQTFEPHILAAIRAADEFFSDWPERPLEVARLLNEALIRAGFYRNDKTESIRVTLTQERKARKGEQNPNPANWKPPTL